MISSACTSRNRSPTLIASRSRRLCRSATSWTIFSSWSLFGALPPIERHPPARALQRQLEPRRIDRLQQVVDRVDLERFDRVLIVRGHEDDVRSRGAAVEHPPRDLEARESRHLHVEKHQVGLQAVDRRRAPRRRCRPDRSRSTPPTCPSRYPSSSRASCSSSTSTARRSIDQSGGRRLPAAIRP